MHLELTPDQEQIIDHAISSGAYRTPSEVLEQAFHILREELDAEAWMASERQSVAAHIATGFAQAERGELADGEAAIEMLRERRTRGLQT